MCYLDSFSYLQLFFFYRHDIPKPRWIYIHSSAYNKKETTRKLHQLFPVILTFSYNCLPYFVCRSGERGSASTTSISFPWIRARLVENCVQMWYTARKATRPWLGKVLMFILFGTLFYVHILIDDERKMVIETIYILPKWIAKSICSYRRLHCKPQNKIQFIRFPSNETLLSICSRWLADCEQAVWRLIHFFVLSRSEHDVHQVA